MSQTPARSLLITKPAHVKQEGEKKNPEKNLNEELAAGQGVSVWPTVFPRLLSA